MAGRGLLSRIDSGDAPFDEIQSILEHLRVLLNTRQGESPCALDYGVVDFSDMVHAFPNALPQLAKSIRATILQYEPRLKNVNVRSVSEAGDLQLRFEITAQLADQKSSKPLKFSTTVRPGGQYVVGG